MERIHIAKSADHASLARYAPSACQSSPEACAKDNRFWEQWDFSNFRTAIDSTFGAVKGQGKYQGIMMILPLGDSPNYWKNIRLMYNSAASHGVQLEAVVFPKWKYGGEYCYLYKSNAPAGCQRGLWNDHGSGLP